MCEGGVPGVCDPPLDKNDLEIQHLQTRGARPDLFLDPTNFMALCTACHRWATDNPKPAEEAGLRIKSESNREGTIEQ